MKFDWTDASQQCGYDWLWSMYREILEDRIVDVFEACVNLELAVCKFVEDAVATCGEDEKVSFSFEPLPEWKPWLQTIAECVHVHVNMPAGMGVGHRALAHKAECKAFGWALQVPKGPGTVNTHARSYAATTGDMGTELGLPQFAVDNRSAASLLPPWMDMNVLPPDVDLDDELSPEGGGVDALPVALYEDGPGTASDVDGLELESSDVDGPRMIDVESVASDIDGPMLDDCAPEEVPAPAAAAETVEQDESWEPFTVGTGPSVLMPNAMRLGPTACVRQR